MAEKKLIITFELDTKTFEPKLVSSTQSAKKFTDQMKKTAAGAKQLQAALTKMGSTATPTGKKVGDLGKQSNQAAFAVLSMNRVISDAPFGFIAISNNIEPLFQAFRNISTETGTFKSKLSVLLKSFAGPNGLMFVLSLATSAATFFALSNRGASKDAEDFATSIDKIKSAIDGLIKIEDPLEKFKVAFDPELLDIAIGKLDGMLETEEAINDAVRNINIAFSGAAGALVDIDDLDEKRIRTIKNVLSERRAELQINREIFNILKNLGVVTDENKDKKEKSLFLTDAQIQAQLEELEALKSTAVSADELLRIQEKITKVIKERERFRPEVPIDELPPMERIVEFDVPLEELPEDEILPDETFEDAKFKAKVIESSLVRVGDEFINLAFKGKFAIESLIEDIGRLIVKMLILRAVQAAISSLFPGLGTAASATLSFAGSSAANIPAGGGTPTAAQIVGAGGAGGIQQLSKQVVEVTGAIEVAKDKFVIEFERAKTNFESKRVGRVN
jgi:hypothetical protein